MRPTAVPAAKSSANPAKEAGITDFVHQLLAGGAITADEESIDVVFSRANAGGQHASIRLDRDRTGRMAVYELETAARLTRLPPARVRRYVRVGLIRPARRSE